MTRCLNKLLINPLNPVGQSCVNSIAALCNTHQYHAAKFITSLPELKAIEFYNSIIKDGKWAKWREQISFLLELDKYRCNKYFILPSCDIIKKQIFNEKGKIKISLFNEYLKDLTINFHEKNKVM